MNDDSDRIAREIARGYGRPPGAAKASDARELELWMERDHTVDVEALWAEHMARGTDPWTAKTQIAVKLYPNRVPLMQAGRPKVADQITFANSIAERAAREQAKRQAEALAAPPSPPMPPALMAGSGPPPLPPPAVPPAVPSMPPTPPAPPPAPPKAVPQAVPIMPAPEQRMGLPGVTRAYETEVPY